MYRTGTSLRSDIGISNTGIWFLNRLNRYEYIPVPDRYHTYYIIQVHSVRTLFRDSLPLIPK